jgi:hypothetical protein
MTRLAGKSDPLGVREAVREFRAAAQPSRPAVDCIASGTPVCATVASETFGSRNSNPKSEFHARNRTS